MRSFKAETTRVAGRALENEDKVESLVASGRMVDIASLLQSQRDLFCYETLSASQSLTWDSSEGLSTPNSEPGGKGDGTEKNGELLLPLTAPSVLKSKNHWHAKRLSGVYAVKRTPKRRRKLFEESAAKENATPQRREQPETAPAKDAPAKASSKRKREASGEKSPPPRSEQSDDPKRRTRKTF